MSKDPILSCLNPEQAAAAGTIDGPVLVLAGAGTGKTRVITYRIAYMLRSGIPPEQILGMTFTNKAAREMRERLASLVDAAVARRVTLGTFHSFCIRILRREIAKLGYLPAFTIADDSDQQGLLKQAAGALGCAQGEFPLSTVQAMISGWKNRLIQPEEARRSADTTFESVAAQIYEEYQLLLEMQNSLDFDDMLMLVYRLFTEHPDVLERYRDHYRYLLIDEYQDTNAAQFTIVKQLAGDRRNLCVVGDDDQSIYSWRGADISNILGFPEQFPGAKVVKLEQNYRSTARILNAANAVIGLNEKRHEKRLWSDLGEGEPVRVVTLENGEAEAEFIGNMIQQLKEQQPELNYRDFALLYRSNHLSRQLEQTLRRQGVPYRLVGGQEFFKRREIKDAVAYLKLLVNPRDDQSLLRILGTPPRGLAQKAVDALKLHRKTKHRAMFELLGEEEFRKELTPKAAEAAAEFAAVCGKYRKEFEEPGNLAGKITAYLREIGYTDGLQRIYKDLKDAMKRRENLDEFINAIAQYETRQAEPATLLAYLENLALLEENDRVEEDSPDADAVTLTTVHASKGLEFPVVFVIAMERNIFPHERALEEGSADEELRLFYVAITRARRQLYLLRAKERMQRGISKPALPSPFLACLTEDLAEHPAPDELVKPASDDAVRAAFANIFRILHEK
ncbi:ATP-dependent helicase [uncultured Victivallis sp.]|uniref:ATP-dependent helicase n=2 Tax=Victivallis TaxID=172900 RepID=UPI0025FDB69C|nr:UvrD-helicase domain-containing protein [uncultured Victivallis sp.]